MTQTDITVHAVPQWLLDAMATQAAGVHADLEAARALLGALQRSTTALTPTDIAQLTTMAMRCVERAHAEAERLWHRLGSPT